MKQAMYYEKLDKGNVRCSLCPHGCSLPVGGTGVCRTRRNIDGELYTLNYGRVASIALDPIEKKPLFHFHPGKLILSVGTFGCNFKCGYCQNWSISQIEARTSDINPEQLSELALEYVYKGNIGVAYTYNEPSIWYEYVYEASKLVRDKGLVNVLVTNGFIGKKPLEELLPFIDAMNIDVKAFSEEFYKKYCGGALRDVKETVEAAAKHCHVEITTLVIPGLNDTPEEIGQLAEWLSTISPDIVLHLTRFFPNYKMKDIRSTPIQTIMSAKESALRYLRYVYPGNI